jgi:uncharacterized protein (DUF697 family)
MRERDELTETSSTELTRGSIETSRMGAYTTLGALTAVVPLPWVPDVILKRVRSTLLHDIASRHGLSLSEDARSILAEPWSTALPRSIVAQVVRFAGRRLISRFGPLGWLSPLRAAVSTFIAGHLFERYLETARSERAMRIDANEALRVRKAVDASLRLFVTMDLDSPLKGVAAPPEDLRDGATQMLDGVILTLTSMPSWAIARLEAAFDEALAAAP